MIDPDTKSDTDKHGNYPIRKLLCHSSCESSRGSRLGRLKSFCLLICNQFVFIFLPDILRFTSSHPRNR